VLAAIVDFDEGLPAIIAAIHAADHNAPLCRDNNKWNGSC
jgi:hypothetical protein